MTIALGYDWVYHELSEDQRRIIELAIVNKGLLPALNAPRNSWVSFTNNWVQVTRGCLVTAALAIGDTNATLANKIMNFSIPPLRVSLEQCAPDGGWPEGYSYGTYAEDYFVLMLRSLETALGHDLGLTSLSGINNIGAWLTHFLGQAGGFSWADGAWKFANANGLWNAGY